MVTINKNAGVMLLLLFQLVLCQGVSKGAQTDEITIHPGTILGQIHSAVLGVNSDTRYDGVSSLRALSKTFAELGITGSRWPGGFHADLFDWRTSSPRYCRSSPHQPNNADGNFDAYMNALVIPNGLSPEITVNYGTGGPDCSGAGDPNLAASWVSYANVTKRYGIRWWEVGNEVYEYAEPNNHSDPHSPQSYATNERPFYALMKAADPNINIGIPITAGAHRRPDWDSYVLANASFDYVVFHYYPEFYPNISDAALLEAPIAGSFAVKKIIGNIRQRVAMARKCVSPCSAYPISISEWNSVSHNPTPQSFSIVAGLFAAETIGEFFNAGVARAEFWVDQGCQINTPGKAGYNLNEPAQVYSWQTGIGTLGLTAVNGIPDARLCSSAGFAAPPGTIFPSGRAFQMYSQSGFAAEGAAAVAVDSSLRSVRSYASYDRIKHRYVVMLINVDGTDDAIVRLSIDGASAGSHYKTMQYSRDIYDETRGSGPWNPPIVKLMGRWDLPMTIRVPPWSMTTYTLDGD